MCFRHWNRVPRIIQRSVWAHYRPGQCDDKRPSEAWHVAADAAIAAVALKEGCRWQQLRKPHLRAIVKYWDALTKQAQKAMRLTADDFTAIADILGAHGSGN